MSPTASHAVRDMNFKNIDHPSLLSAAMSDLKKFTINTPFSPASPTS
jgi:hypothetical protein